MTATPEALQFIKDYQKGRYGYGVRGDYKALMYHQALLAPSADDLPSLRRTMEECMAGGGKCAWVNQEGDVYFVGFGYHVSVARYVFFAEEGEFEKTHAKVTQSTTGLEDAIKYVKKPSDHMCRSVLEVLDGTYDRGC